MPNDITTRREQQIRSMLLAVAEERAHSGGSRFRPPLFPNSEVTADDYVVFLLSILAWTDHRAKRSEVAQAILGRIQPPLAAPLGEKQRWNKEYLARWLRFAKEASSSPETAWRIVTGLAWHCEGLIKGCENLRELINKPRATLEEAARAIVDTVREDQIPEWSRPFGYNAQVGDFSAKPRAFDNNSLQSVAKKVLEHLTDSTGPRVAVIRGGPHSGKKVVLRHIVELLGNDGLLTLTNDIRIPTLTLALDDHDARSVVDTVYRFLASARYRPEDIDRRIAELDEKAKLSRIAAMAKEVPSCVLLSDIAAMEEDEVVRSLAGFPAAEVITSLLNGHRFTRVAFTTKLDSDLGDVALEASLKCSNTQFFPVPGSFSINFVFEKLGFPTLDNEPDREINGLTARLAQIAVDLTALSPDQDVAANLQICREALMDEGKPPVDGDTEPKQTGIDAIVELICRKLLTPEEFLIVAMIATSHDGLRASVLHRISAALVRMEGPSSTSELAEDPIQLRRQLDKTVERLKDLIQTRKVVVERALRREGDGEGQEHLYAIDDGWRRQVLRVWYDQDRIRARAVHWLIAREATDQSRALRLTRWQGRYDASFGRDVQALHALIGSIDTVAIRSRDDAEASRDSSATAELDCPETVVLPYLDQDAPLPSADLALRYCYLQLYAADLDGIDFGLLSRKQDATTRLGILLRIFSPQTPWMHLEERGLSTRLDDYGHILSAFSASETIELLLATSISALRLERYDVVAAAARLGQELFDKRQGAGINKISLMRLFRVEIDAGLLIGGNPDVLPLHIRPLRIGLQRPQNDLKLAEVSRRVEELLDGPFAAPADSDWTYDLMQARGKLLIRHAETCHISGRFHAARHLFEAAIAIEKRLMGIIGERSIAPTFGGRGARSYLRYLLDRVRLTARRGRWPTFIFIDELEIPAPPFIEGSRDLTHARNIQAICTRRANSERIVDAIGLKIDAARLSVLKHDFVSAYRGLGAVLADRLLSGSSLEILLELLAVQTRYLLDGTILCLQGNAIEMAGDKATVPFSSSAEISRIAAYLGLDERARPIEVAQTLFPAFQQSHATFCKLLDSRRTPIRPFSIFRDYLGILGEAVESRFCPPAEVEAKLKDAQAKLAEVIDAMEDSGYRMHQFEAVRLQRGIDHAIRHYVP